MEGDVEGVAVIPIDGIRADDLEVRPVVLAAHLGQEIRLCGSETLERSHGLNPLRFKILDKSLARLISGGPSPRHR